MPRKVWSFGVFATFGVVLPYFHIKLKVDRSASGARPETSPVPLAFYFRATLKSRRFGAHSCTTFQGGPRSSSTLPRPCIRYWPSQAATLLSWRLAWCWSPMARLPLVPLLEPSSSEVPVISAPLLGGTVYFFRPTLLFLDSSDACW